MSIENSKSGLQILLVKPLYKLFAIALIVGLAEASVIAQIDVDRYVKDFRESVELRDKVSAMRSLSTAVIKQEVDAVGRESILKFLAEVRQDENPVLRLNIHIEILKIAAAESDSELGKMALTTADDANINVRRGIMKYFRSYFAGRFEQGAAYRDLLLRKLDDEDLEIRHHAAALAHSWGVSNNKIVDVLLDSLELTNYRASTIYTLATVEKNRAATIAKTVDRLKVVDENAPIYLNLLSLLTPQSNSEIQTVMSFYESDQPEIRLAVVDAVGKMAAGSENAIELLEKALDDPNAVVRQSVIGALQRSGANEDVIKAAVVKQLSDTDKNVSRQAGQCIGFFEQEFDNVLPDFSQILASENIIAITSILDGFTICGPMAAAAKNDMLKLFDHEQTDVAFKAMYAMLEVAPVADSALIEKLNQLVESDPRENVRYVALQTLGQYEPKNEKSKQQFLKFLNNENDFVRYSCVHGLKNFIDASVARQIIKVAEPASNALPGQFTPLNQKVDEVLNAGGELVAKVATEFLSNDDPIVLGRAIRVVGNSNLANSAEIRKSIIAALSSDDRLVSFSAAMSVSKLKEVSADEVMRVFELTDPANRQRTAQVLALIGSMGARGSVVAPQIAGLVNGEFRGRFTNVAKNTLIQLGEHAASAIPELVSSKASIPVFESLWAIGQQDEEATKMIENYLEKVEKRISTNRNVNSIAIDRRGRFFAATAHAKASGDPSVASKVIRKELQTDLRAIALRMIEKVYTQDESLIDDVINCLPEMQAISTLANIGPKAAKAVPELRDLIKTEKRDLAVLAKQAVWQITDDTDLATTYVREVLEQNRSEPIQIELQYRQTLWSALRFLAQRQSTDLDAKKLLDEIEVCRFAQLRNFVKELPRQ